MNIYIQFSFFRQNIYGKTVWPKLHFGPTIFLRPEIILVVRKKMWSWKKCSPKENVDPSSQGKSRLHTENQLHSYPKASV